MKNKYEKLLKTGLEHIWSWIKEHYIILTIILVFVILHIPRITTPPIDEHGWRQSDTASVIRNFSEESPNILYPRIDMRSQYSGITGMEFPLYNYSVFLLNRIIGFENWHGRLLTLMISAISLLYFYELIVSLYSKNIAIMASIVLAFSPLYFLFAKNIQPDMLMVCTSIASLYFVQMFKKGRGIKYLYFSWISLSIAILVKVPAIFIILPYVWVLGIDGITNLLKNHKIVLSVGAGVILLPSTA